VESAPEFSQERPECQTEVPQEHGFTEGLNLFNKAKIRSFELIINMILIVQNEPLPTISIEIDEEKNDEVEQGIDVSPHFADDSTAYLDLGISK
jgi:hypothetical protein